jgi:CHAT domain-containing protein
MLLRVTGFAAACFLSLAPGAVGAADASAPEPDVLEPQLATGDSAAELLALEARLDEFEKAGDRDGAVAILLQMANAAAEQGMYRVSLSWLERAQALTDGAADPGLRATVLSRLADGYLVTGDVAAAGPLLEEALSLVQSDELADVRVLVLINLGNLHARQGRDAVALDDYRFAERTARKTGDVSLSANALTNTTRLLTETGQGEAARRSLQSAVAVVEQLADGYEKAFLQISLGRLAADIARVPGIDRDALRLVAFRLFEQAAIAADALGSPRLASWAYGGLGELYAGEDRHSEAERLLRKASFLAREAGADDILYRWLWQTGRLHAAAGQTATAIADYRDAVAALQRVRSQLGIGERRERATFRETTGPLYYELADLLLRAPDTDHPAGDRLRDARQTVELLKAVELQEYFQDHCVTALSARTSGVDRVAPNTAVLYVIPLPDRLELLLSLPGGMRQVTVPVEGAVLRETIVAFRGNLENRTTRRYLRQAWQLYDWLIRPIEPLLEAQEIDTLVTVPQGALTMIPFAALHDGKQFLVEKYALATTPGLALTDPGGMQKQDIDALLAGLSESVQGFPPLPNVPLELDEAHAVLGGALLEDRAFSGTNLHRELEAEPYTVVHLASHAQFKGNSEDTFLLTWESRLNLDSLEDLVGLGEFRQRPVELLVLSACQTAVGDEQAALGLAGVAVKAGARSALASLWFVNDAGTSRLMSEFYRQLRQPGVSKAEALQAAQIDTLRDRRYRHPGYWAPFLLIGNWL